MKLEGKVAIVTGSSKGIGLGIARVFHGAGAKVVVVSRTAAAGEKIAAELGSADGKALYVQTDVTSAEDVARLVETTIERYGRLDVLVNNAGYHISKTVEETSIDEWNFIQQTNLFSTFICSKLAIPHLKTTRGTIINISSMVGQVGQPSACAYAATKGGQIAMSKGMAIDLARYGIRVNVICPGWIQTPLVDDWFGQQDDEAAARQYILGQHPLGRIGTIEECGRAALFLACADDSSFVTGITLDVDGGITLGY